VADRPIIFSADSVRAILDGRKTQTRRVVKLREFQRSDTPGYDYTFRDIQLRWHDYREGGLLASKRVPFHAGDRLWVKETFTPCGRGGSASTVSESTFAVLRDGTQVYRDGVIVPALPQYAEGAFSGLKWRSPIYMPRYASRLTLAVLSVRVERVQDITEEDALAEGVPEDDDRPLPGFPCPKCGGDGTIMTGYPPDYGATWIDCGACDTATKRFSLMWGAINGKRAPWASNPWVWVIEFRKVTDG